MDERHENEQYFFSKRSVAELAQLFDRFRSPCLLCAPTLAQAFVASRKDVTLLDIDERFADVPGFRSWDLTRPDYLDEEFDLIFCDPPFFNVSLSQLFAAIRMLAHFDHGRPVALTYLSRRAAAIETTFASFGLARTDHFIDYQTVVPGPKNDIQLFSNFELAQ